MSEFVIKTEPEKNIVFASEKLGEEPVSSLLKMTNTSAKDLIFKVKCTSNEMFRIRPPMSILRQSQSETIKLVFNSGKTIPENGKHYFAIYYVFIEGKQAEEKTARELWADHVSGSFDGTRRMYIEFKKEKLEEAKDAKEGKDKKEEAGEAAAAKVGSPAETPKAAKEEEDKEKEKPKEAKEAKEEEKDADAQDKEEKKDA